MTHLIGTIVLGLPISVIVTAIIASLFRIEDEDAETKKSAVIFIYLIYVGIALISYG